MAKDDLKSRSELVEDIIKSFDNTWDQVNAWHDSRQALFAFYNSFRGVLERSVRNLKEAESEKDPKV